MFKRFKKPLVYLLMTMLITPAYLFSLLTNAGVAHASGINTQDFGVMQFSQVNGYSVGFSLIGMTAGDLKSVEVKLYEGETVLSINTSNKILDNYPTATALSSPFNINGYFDYHDDDDNWINSGWVGTVEDVPTKATVMVIDKSDKSYSAEYGAPTGDPNLLKPHAYTGADALAMVQPQDFGTMRFSDVSGYTVGFKSLLTAAQMKKIQVSLYKDEKVLATATSDKVSAQYPTAKELSAPFDVNGNFNYTSDGAWSYDGWKGTLADAPTKAVIVVTDKMDNTYTVENINLTGAPLPYIVAQDFGVMQISGVNGYTVGFGLHGITAADIAEVRVELFKDGQSLSVSDGNIAMINSLAAATNLSAPFNIDGSFDYEADGYWINNGWNGSILDVPDMAVVSLTDSLGARYRVENSHLTGDPSLLLPQVSPTSPVITSLTQGSGAQLVIGFTGIGSEATSYRLIVNGVLIPNEIPANIADVYSVTLDVAAYKTYDVQVIAYHFGYEIGKSEAKSIEVKAPAVSTNPINSLVNTASAEDSTTYAPIETSNVQPAPTAQASATATSGDDQGQIKGDEAVSNSDDEKETNWTPWIILFILIILAGAATGGYFYWFAGDEVEEKPAKESKPKVTTSNSKPKSEAKKTEVKNTGKKSKRW